MGNPNPTSDAAMPAVKAAISSMADIIQQRITTRPMATHIATGSLDDDLHHNTDLRIAYAANIPIAVRVREHHYMGRYGNEFTIRSRTRTGCDTEIHKIMQGEGRIFFYGFISADGPHQLDRYTLCDLDVFRSWHTLRDMAGAPTHTANIPNGDGTWFHSYRYADLPPDFVIHAWDRRTAAQEALF